MTKNNLDSLDALSKIDRHNMLQFCVNAAQHYKESVKNSEKIKVNYSMPESIIVAGMGGSGIGGELLKDYTKDKASLPIEVSKDYRLPAYANEKTLVITVSYSGDTEETLSAFLDAIKRKCMVYCISSGGNLIKFAQNLSIPYLQVPAGMPPRAALPHLFVPLLKLTEKLCVVPCVSAELAEAIEMVEKISEENKPQKTLKENFTKNLALNLSRTAPVVYGFGIYRGVSMRWKQQFNENSKIPAKWEVFSELNHNEIVGWEEPTTLSKGYAVVFIRDKDESLEIRNRIENTKNIVRSTLLKMFEVWAQGKNNLTKILTTTLVGDFVSVYLALLRQIDPTPVKSINILKENLSSTKIKEKTIRELEKLAAN
ncbi:MAG: bifunctional phosphoglucose/phosphomannose isomerase [Candidatus Bathyarchaeota archaeon]|nr:bifunctional phosphoglucose/phosphomannose isomerase [Candidatus Bathyarchaeota archaeon]